MSDILIKQKPLGILCQRLPTGPQLIKTYVEVVITGISMLMLKVTYLKFKVKRLCVTLMLRKR